MRVAGRATQRAGEHRRDLLGTADADAVLHERFEEVAGAAGVVEHGVARIHRSWPDRRPVAKSSDSGREVPEPVEAPYDEGGSLITRGHRPCHFALRKSVPATRRDQADPRPITNLEERRSVLASHGLRRSATVSACLFVKRNPERQ